MFDTMTMTKIVGAVCGALLIFLFGKWAADAIYTTGGGHGETAQAYTIDTGTEAAPETAPDTAAEGPAFADLLAAADAAAGEKVFGKCKACHKIDGNNGTGPHLDGVMGRDVASVAGFGFSAALTGIDGNWTPEALNAFLESPKGFAPGTKMTFAGLPKATDRANVIAYLQGLGG